MLREIPHVRQIAGEPQRRWFSSPTLDLIVWLEENDEIVGFQLCYDKTRHERAITWRRDTGFAHEAVDDGEGRPGKYKATPILLPDGAFQARTIAGEFQAQSAEVAPRIAGFVHAKLMEYS